MMPTVYVGENLSVCSIHTDHTKMRDREVDTLLRQAPQTKLASIFSVQPLPQLGTAPTVTKNFFQ